MILKNAPKVPYASTNNKVTSTIKATIANTGCIPQYYLGTINPSFRSTSATDYNTFTCWGCNKRSQHESSGLEIGNWWSAEPPHPIDMYKLKNMRRVLCFAKN